MKFNKKNLEEKLDRIFYKYPRLKKLIVNVIKYYFPDNSKSLEKLYLYNTAGLLLSLYICYIITHKFSSDYITPSVLQYSTYDILSALYLKVDKFKEYIKKVIPYV
ncbi:hypothetical protein YN1_6570 [Nanoarchaeota archaeon]